MTIVQFDAESREVKRCSATAIQEVADAMLHADYGTWIEGIGQPMCHQDLETWKTLGAFLANVAKETTTTIDGLNVWYCDRWPGVTFEMPLSAGEAVPVHVAAQPQ